MFKKLIIAGILCVTQNLFAMNIVVIDYQKALLESQMANDYAKKNEKIFSSQLLEITKMEKDAEDMRVKFEKEAAKLSAAQKRQRETQFQDKKKQASEQMQKLQKAKEEADYKAMQAFTPILNRAVSEIINEGDYDLVLSSEAIIDVKVEFDVTQLVIERLNKIHQETNENK